MAAIPTSAELKLLIRKRLRTNAVTGDQTGETIFGVAPGKFGVISPAFPLHWPASGDSIIFYVYEYSVLPTGASLVDVRGPTHSIVFSKPYEIPTVETLKSIRYLGHDENPEHSAESASRLAKAENLLIGRIIGAPDTTAVAMHDLSPYAEWLARHRAIAGDLEKRAGLFMEAIKNAVP
jgi:hypothetical protein